MKLRNTALLATVAGILTGTVLAQTVPNVATPPAIPKPGTALTTNLVWTLQQWGIGWAAKKDVLVFFVQTSGSTAVKLTTDGTTASSSNVGKIPSSTAIQYSAQCIVIDRTTRAANIYTAGSSAISNIAGTVAVSGANPAITAGPTLGGGLTLGAVITIVADNTNKGWAIAFTPPAANTDPVYAQCTLELLVVN